jgi:hypothetical protein
LEVLSGLGHALSLLLHETLKEISIVIFVEQWEEGKDAHRRIFPTLSLRGL